MAVEGGDGIFFGFADFSISAGVPLKTGHEKGVGAIKKAAETADAYGKFVIYPIGFPPWEQVELVKDLGIQAVEFGHDKSILKSVWQKSIQSFRPDR